MTTILAEPALVEEMIGGLHWWRRGRLPVPGGC